MSLAVPSRSVISFSNKITDEGASIVSATSELNLFRKENLLSPKRSEAWRSTSTAQQDLIFRFPVADTVQVFALMNCNIASSQTVVLSQASDAAFTTNVATWNLTTYAQSNRRVLRWYLGSADSGSAASRSFWRVRLPTAGTDVDEDGNTFTWYEVGAIWMGDIAEIPLDPGLQRTLVDPSDIMVTDNGSRFADIRPTYHQVAASSKAMAETDGTFTYMDLLDDGGTTRHALWDLWANETGDAVKRANGTYYGTFGSRDEVMRFTRSLQLRDDLSWSFTEARA